MTSNPAPESQDKRGAEERDHFWRPAEERDRFSVAGRKWRQENAEAASEWAKWVETKGTPLRPLF